MDKKQRPIAGIVLIVIGVIFLIERIVVVPDVDLHMGRLWPLILVAIGVAKLLSGRDQWAGGIVMAWIGSVFLLHTMHILALRYSWPLFIVGGGLGVMLGGWCCADRATGGGGKPPAPAPERERSEPQRPVEPAKERY